MILRNLIIGIATLCSLTAAQAQTQRSCGDDAREMKSLSDQLNKLMAAADAALARKASPAEMCGLMSKGARVQEKALKKSKDSPCGPIPAVLMEPMKAAYAQLLEYERHYCTQAGKPPWPDPQR